MTSDSMMNITLAEFRRTPFCPYYIIDTLVSNGYNTLGDIATMNEFDAYSIPGFGKGKVKQLMAFKDMLTGAKADIVKAFYTNSIGLRRLPDIPETSSTAEKIANVLSAVSSTFEQRGKMELAAICRLGFMENQSRADVHRGTEHLSSLCGERIRQQMVWVKNAILTNGLMRYRIEIDGRFTAELKEIAGEFSSRPLSALKERLGADAPEHAYSNLFGLDIVRADRYNAGAVEQDYLVSSEYGVLNFTKDLGVVINELHNEVRPVSFSALLSKVKAERPSLTCDSFQRIIEHSSMIERTETGDIQMRYAALRDYERTARIVWEEKKVTKDRIDLMNSIRTGETRTISNNLQVAQNRFGWCRPAGKSGFWYYSETEDSAAVDVRDCVRSYVESHDLFMFSDALGYVREQGFDYPDSTVRAYFVELCRIANKDMNLLCDINKADRHPEISWRHKRVANAGDTVLSFATDYIRSNGPVQRATLIREILDNDTENLFNYRCVYNTIYNLVRGKRGIVMDESGLIDIDSTSDAKAAERSTNRQLPEHYAAVLAVIKSKLSMSPDKTCSLASLRAACESIIRPYANPNLFYKIVSTYRPEGIEKVHIGRNAYLRQTA